MTNGKRSHSRHDGSYAIAAPAEEALAPPGHRHLLWRHMLQFERSTACRLHVRVELRQLLRQWLNVWFSRHSFIQTREGYNLHGTCEFMLTDSTRVKCPQHPQLYVVLRWEWLLEQSVHTMCKLCCSCSHAGSPNYGFWHAEDLQAGLL